MVFLQAHLFFHIAVCTSLCICTCKLLFWCRSKPVICVFIIQSLWTASYPDSPIFNFQIVTSPIPGTTLALTGCWTFWLAPEMGSVTLQWILVVTSSKLKDLILLFWKILILTPASNLFHSSSVLYITSLYVICTLTLKFCDKSILFWF